MSLLPPPRCIETTAESSEGETRASPPGITAQESPTAATKTRSTMRRGARVLSDQTGAVEMCSSSWPVKLYGRASIRSSSLLALFARGELTAGRPAPYSNCWKGWLDHQGIEILAAHSRERPADRTTTWPRKEVSTFLPETAC